MYLFAHRQMDQHPSSGTIIMQVTYLDVVVNLIHFVNDIQSFLNISEPC